MANIKSAKLRVKKTAAKTSVNNYWKRKINILSKEFNSSQDKKKRQESYKKLASSLDKAAKRNVIHKNKAKRLKSRFSKSV